MWVARSVHVNNGLDEARVGLEPIRKNVRHFVKGGVMRDPPTSVDPAVFDQPDDSRKVPRQGIATGHERQLAAMHYRRVRQIEILPGYPDIHDAAGKGGEFNGTDH